jgi:dTMP kinase
VDAVRNVQHLTSGLFMTFEGGEGSGKSTQMRLLAEHLRADGLAVIETREPGGSPAAEIIREVLLSGRAERHGPEVEAALFSAARRDHVDSVIRPALDRGMIVLCDRFLDSTRVYQGVTGRLARPFIAGIEALATGGLLPDVTFLLDIPAADGLARARARSAGGSADRFEKENVAVHEARRSAYLSIAKAEPDRVAVVSASRAERQIANDIALIARTHIAAAVLREEENADG